MTITAQIAVALVIAIGGALPLQAADTPPEDTGAALKWAMERGRSSVRRPTRISDAAAIERAQLLHDGETALTGGEAERAAALFERAALMLHATDAELGLVRAYMQAGHYRQAVTFAAHTAGAHPDTPAGAALYAWLLHLGGHAQPAAGVLKSAMARAPNDPIIYATGMLMTSPAPILSDILLQPPARYAPYSHESSALPANSIVAGSGVLIDAGRQALTESAIVDGAKAIWVRDGLGRLSKARTGHTHQDIGVAVLWIEKPFAVDASPYLLPPRDPFPGSPGYTIRFAVSNSSGPAWPQLQAGFHGIPDSVTGVYQLGISNAPGPQGGPVFDVGGRLAGIAVRGSDGRALRIAHSLLRERFGDVLGAEVSAAVANERAPIDLIYERALTRALQVIIEP